MKRTARIERKTTETNIVLELNVDGSGTYDIHTPVGFFNHMMELFAKHGFFDLSLAAGGDVEIDFHHTVEDAGICLGQAFKKALGAKENIIRYADVKIPMDEALAQVSLDISGRPYFVYNGPDFKGKVGDFDLELVEEFFQAFAVHSAVTLHVSVLSGKNNHHIVEAIFKACARAMDKATQRDKREAGIPSTKGTL